MPAKPRPHQHRALIKRVKELEWEIKSLHSAIGIIRAKLPWDWSMGIGMFSGADMSEGFTCPKCQQKYDPYQKGTHHHCPTERPRSLLSLPW